MGIYMHCIVSMSMYRIFFCNCMQAVVMGCVCQSRIKTLHLAYFRVILGSFQAGRCGWHWLALISFL